MVDEGWTTVEKKAPAGAGRTSGGGRPDQVGRSGANRMSGTYRTRPQLGRLFVRRPFSQVANPPFEKGEDLIGDGSRARPRATRHPDRVRPAPHPPRRTHPLGAPLHPAHRLNKPHPNPRPQCRRRTQRWARPGRGSRRRVVIREPELAYRRERTGHAPRRYERR